MQKATELESYVHVMKYVPVPFLDLWWNFPDPLHVYGNIQLVSKYQIAYKVHTYCTYVQYIPMYLCTYMYVPMYMEEIEEEIRKLSSERKQLIIIRKGLEVKMVSSLIILYMQVIVLINLGASYGDKARGASPS